MDSEQGYRCACTEENVVRGCRTHDARAAAEMERLRAIIGRVRAIHSTVPAVMYSGRREQLVQVCAGCGTDDGNWMRWPCPTIRAMEEGK